MKKSVLLLISALCLLQFSSAQSSTSFSNGDRWCALGDSITHGGSYHREVEVFYVTRFPESKLEVINCGIGGDRASGALRRLSWDCLDHKPTVVSVMLGMNDVNRNLYDASNIPSSQLEALKGEANGAYRTNMATLTSLITNSGARLILITPSIFDDTGQLKATNKPGCAAALSRFAHEVESLAAQRGALLVDFNGPMTTINTAVQKTNASASIVGPDRVHPGPVGHFVMAYEFLKAQKPSGDVSRIGVDAASGKAVSCDNCDLTDIKATPEELSFTCLEKSLPFPLTDEIKGALDFVPFNSEFNRETLKVSGLKPGSYKLSIDGNPIRNYTADELASGVNLATEQTPQLKQAEEVRKILGKKWAAAAKIRSIAAMENGVGGSSPHSDGASEAATMKSKIDSWALVHTTDRDILSLKAYNESKPNESALNKTLLDTAAEAHAAAKPFPHQFALKKVPTPAS